MIDKIADSLQFQGEALKLRSERQQVLSSNIINADTPGYKAVDFDFARALQNAVGSGSGVSSSGSPAAPAAPALVERGTFQPSLDGNTVNMDVERSQFVDNSLRYEAALRALNMHIKTLLSAIQG